MEQRKITDDLHALMDVLPADIAQAVTSADDSDNLLEVILDLGRLPTARFVDSELALSQEEAQREEIDYVVSQLKDLL